MVKRWGASAGASGMWDVPDLAVGTYKFIAQNQRQQCAVVNEVILTFGTVTPPAASDPQTGRCRKVPHPGELRCPYNS